MTVFVISCALRDVAHDYSPFWKALEKAGAIRAMEAVWLLDTPQSVEQITAAVLPHLTAEDRLLVAVLGQWSATRLLDGAADWLRMKAP